MRSTKNFTDESADIKILKNLTLIASLSTHKMVCELFLEIMEISHSTAEHMYNSVIPFS